MTKTDKAIDWARSLAADVAPKGAGDLVETVKAKAAKWSTAAQDGLIDARHRFARQRPEPQTRAEELADLVKARAAKLSAVAQDGWSGVAKSGRRAGVPGLALATLAGGVLLGLGLAELLRRRRLRDQEADVGTYFSHQDVAPAGDPLFDSSEEAYLAQGAGFEDPLCGEPIPEFGTPTSQRQ